MPAQTTGYYTKPAVMTATGDYRPLLCRAGGADPARFGLSQMKEGGSWWIAANLLRDVAALNNMEMLPWDVWGGMVQPGETPTAERLARLDAAVPSSLAPDAHFDELRALYDDPDWRVPERVLNVQTQQLEAA